MEILEAGTGQGALTLFLARAIHAANAFRPKPDSPSCEAQEGSQLASQPQPGAPSPQRSPGQDDHLESQSKYFYKHRNDNRQAVIHTVDVSRKHSKHAEQVVSGFRQGLYTHDIIFHVGDVSEWMDEQVSDRGLGTEKAFLSHVVLDMPSASFHVEKAASILHTNGSLLAFNPSITQIISIIKVIKQLRLPLVLSSVLELGLNSGGRDWDVRTIIPRALTRKAEAHMREDDASRSADQGSNDGTSADPAESDTADEDNDEDKEPVYDQVTVCRPKSGYRVAGGGFLGVWTKMKH